MNNWTIMVYISADNVLANFAVESLKQLKRSASKDVVVVAQVDANGRRAARRYRFDGSGDSNSSIEDDRVEPVSTPTGGIANPETLRQFITWAAKSPESTANHYCLFPWGHGYELLLDEDQPRDNENQANGSARRYLTPANLRESLKDTPLTKGGRKLDIIGIDACSMGQVEVASELQDVVNFMIASQEEVPDASFPYERLLQRLKLHDPNDVEGICEAVPGLYKEAYQDYLVALGAGMRPITLSSLRLGKIATITAPLKRLANALLSSTSDAGLRREIVLARSVAQGFALGLFVDLFGFCSQLSTKIANGELKSACDDICEAIGARGEDSCVIENQTGKGDEKTCHGLSIYFPYRADGEDEKFQKSLVAGRTDLVDQLPLLVKGGSNILKKALSGRIGELEQDFKLLHHVEETDWNRFITNGWSFILAKERPEELDLRYSAQQCALNLLSLCEERKPEILPKAHETRTRLVGGPKLQEQPQAS